MASNVWDHCNFVGGGLRLRFVLYRHWSIYEAAYHTPYLATRMLVWTDAGSANLKSMLAKCGYVRWRRSGILSRLGA